MFQLDHVVYACSSLDQADKFALRTFGVKPVRGGKHESMGTHNSLIRFDTPDYCYIEFICVDPDPIKEVFRPKWFGLSQESLLDELRRNGPKLIHFVVACRDLQDTKQDLETSLKCDLGEIIQGSRRRIDGELIQWKITVRKDRNLLRDGTIPTLIEWSNMNQHPSLSIPSSSFRLRQLQICTDPDISNALRRFNLSHVAFVDITSSDGAADNEPESSRHIRLSWETSAPGLSKSNL